MDIELLAPPLKKILDAELAQGNSIHEISAWPPKCHLLIILKLPFNRPYNLEKHVAFAEINDPHYWKSEYRYLDGYQCLACGFGG